LRTANCSLVSVRGLKTVKLSGWMQKESPWITKTQELTGK